MTGTRHQRSQRRGALVVLVAICLTMIMGFAALGIDVGYMYVTRAELQRTADAAALAATGVLRTAGQDVNAETLAATIADQFGKMNEAAGEDVEIAASDVTIGSYWYDANTGKLIFDPTDARFPSAVNVVARRPDLKLWFAHFLGIDAADVSAEATAALQPRDIAVVIDLSGSMKHDSYLRFYDQTQINARDIWASLDGPEPSIPYIPGAEHETEYAGDTGPTIGMMSLWGDAITPNGWGPTTDPGLWYIPNNQPTVEPDIANGLLARGYTIDQITTLMAGSNSQWANRTAVMIGLAEWSPSGAGDTSVNGNELSWIPYPPYRKNWQWSEYIGWAGEARSKLTRVHPEFRFRFGLKTYTDFLLDRKDNFSQTDLTKTPEEPLRAVKDGVQAMVDTTGTVDQMSLEIFGSTGRHEVDLSLDRQAVADRLYDMQANHYDNSTNMGEGLQRAIDELTSSRGRDTAMKVIVCMSDGQSNRGPDPVGVAQQAADLPAQIYTVSVGANADRSTMQSVAAVSGGQEFYAFGHPEEYTQQLQAIFRTIGGTRMVVLIE